MVDDQDSPRSKRTPAIRVLEILEQICSNADPDIADISDRLGIPQPTVYRNIESLIEAGFIVRDPSNRLSSGARLRSILFSSLIREPSVTARRALLQALSEEIQETVSISVPQGNTLVYFDRIEAHWPLRFNLQIGDKLPILGSASGKLYLSSMAGDEALSIFRETPAGPTARNTITSADNFVLELNRIRYEGYALDNEEFFDGMIGAAVPIRNQLGNPCAFLSTHCLAIRKSILKLKAEIPKMFECAKRLEDLFFGNEGMKSSSKIA